MWTGIAALVGNSSAMERLEHVEYSSRQPEAGATPYINAMAWHENHWEE